MLATCLFAAPAAFADDNDKNYDYRDQRGWGDQNGRRRQPIVSGYSPTQVRAGGEVVITGDNFRPSTQVFVGGVEVVAPRITAGSISFAMPAGMTGGALVVRVPGARADITAGNLTLIVDDYRWNRDERNGWDRMDDDDLGRFEQELRGNRDQRRFRRAGDLRTRWGNRFLASPAAKAELALHAERSAHLKRMLRVAKQGDRRALIVRINRAIKREDARHDAAMEGLRQSYTARR